MNEIVLVTSHDLPGPDLDTPLLERALRERGQRVQSRAWDSPEPWHPGTTVLIRSPWDYVHRRAEFLAWAQAVSRTCTVLNPVPLLSWSSHKGYLRDLADAGVPIVPTSWVPVGADEAQRRATLAALDGEIVIKPAVSIGAFGALRARADSTQAAQHLAALTQAGDALAQPLIGSVPIQGEVSMLYFGGVFSHAVRKIPATDDFRVHRMYGGAVVAHEPSTPERSIGAAAIAAAPVPPAYARVDVVHIEGARYNGPAIMELELIEPELFLPMDPHAAARFADHLCTRAASS